MEKNSPAGGRPACPQRPPRIRLGLNKQTQVTLPADLAIVISRKAFSQLFGYAEATQLEVSLLGVVDRDASTFTKARSRYPGISIVSPLFRGRTSCITGVR